MISGLRLLTVGGVLAYRALFNWATPAMYIGTLLASPLAQLLFFAYLGRQLGVADDRFFLIGNALLGASIAGVYGGTMALANERRYGTLGMVLLSPRNRIALFLGRALPYAGNGLLIAVFTLTVGALLLGARIPLWTLPGLLVVLALGSLSCAFFGLMLGALGLRFRDVFTVANLAAIVLVFVSGANVPRTSLPGWLQGIGEVLPTTHAIEAGRALTNGASFGSLGPALLREVLVLVGYAAVAIILLRFFEARGRRHGELDTA
jgi:ABC-type multidrug transport system permease subunit